MLKTADLIKDTDPFIRTKSELVPLPLSKEDSAFLLSMLEHIKASQDEESSQKYDLRPGVGLAAIQAGQNKRMLVVYYEDDENDVIYEYALINPKIIAHSIQKAFLTGGEGCLSVEEKYEGYIHRYHKITVRAFDLIQNKEITIKAKGYLAIVLQHELDHLDGILFYDHINKQQPFMIMENAIAID